MTATAVLCAVRARLIALDADARALAGAAAVLGDGAPAGRAAEVAGMSVEDAERAADALAGAGLLAPERPLRFAHPLLRAAMYAAMPLGARAVAHRRAVRLHMQSGSAFAAPLAHALAVEPAGDAIVAEALIDAGRRALAAGAPDVAAPLLERALAEPPPHAHRLAVRSLLGVALARLRDERAPALLREVLTSPEFAGVHALVSVELVDALWLTGDTDAALRFSRAAGGELPAGLAAAVAARNGTAPGAEIASLARAGLAGPTVFERCCAAAALIACDELAAAARALDVLAAGARSPAELAMIERLGIRLAAVTGPDPAAALLPGPDPGPAPWEAWADDRSLSERFGTASARGAALVAAAGNAIGTRRTELLDEAVSVLRASPRRLALAHALTDLGRALRHGGRRRAARAALREALDLAQRLGAADLAAQISGELRVAGARPRRELLSGPESLTAAELRVAEVAALGLSNRDIAARLFLSPKTVEMHLGRVYRKLDIASRAELARALGDRLAAAA